RCRGGISLDRRSHAAVLAAIVSKPSTARRVVGRVTLAVALCAGIARPATAQDYARTPVFFVHGYSATGASFDAMRTYLRNHGYPAQFLRAIDLVPNTGPN